MDRYPFSVKVFLVAAVFVWVNAGCKKKESAKSSPPATHAAAPAPKKEVAEAPPPPKKEEPPPPPAPKKFDLGDATKAEKSAEDDHADMAKKLADMWQQHDGWVNDDKKAAAGNPDPVHAKLEAGHKALLKKQKETEAKHKKMSKAHAATVGKDAKNAAHAEADYAAMVKDHEQMKADHDKMQKDFNDVLKPEHDAMIEGHKNQVAVAPTTSKKKKK